VDSGTDQLLAQGNFGSQFVTLSGFSLTVTSGTVNRLLVVFDLSATATIGRTVRATSQNSTYIGVAAPDTVDPTSFPVGSNASTIQTLINVLTVSGTTLAPATVLQGETQVIMEKLTFTADAGQVNITGIRLNELGTSTNDADVSTIYLYDDANDNNAIEPTETQLGTGTFVSQEALIDISSQNFVVSSTASRSLLIVYSIASNATAGKTLRASLTNSTFVTVLTPDSVAATNFPLQSGSTAVQDVAEDLLVTRSQQTLATTVARGATKFQVCQLQFSIPGGQPGETVQVSSLRVDNAATPSGNDATLKVYDDSNGDWIIDAGEPPWGRRHLPLERLR